MYHNYDKEHRYGICQECGHQFIRISPKQKWCKKCGRKHKRKKGFTFRPINYGAQSL